LFLRTENCVAFALAGDNPTSEPAILRMAYNYIANIGRFDTACQEWRNIDPAPKIWEFFDTEFKADDK
jgi:hypothetical protein